MRFFKALRESNINFEILLIWVFFFAYFVIGFNIFKLAGIIVTVEWVVESTLLLTIAMILHRLLFRVNPLVINRMAIPPVLNQFFGAVMLGTFVFALWIGNIQLGMIGEISIVCFQTAMLLFLYRLSENNEIRAQVSRLLAHETACLLSLISLTFVGASDLNRASPNIVLGFAIGAVFCSHVAYAVDLTRERITDVQKQYLKKR